MTTLCLELRYFQNSHAVNSKIFNLDTIGMWDQIILCGGAVLGIAGC